MAPTPRFWNGSLALIPLIFQPYAEKYLRNLVATFSLLAKSAEPWTEALDAIGTFYAKI
jgi:hypothetical protein